MTDNIVCFKTIFNNNQNNDRRGAGPCRLGADHADYADFSNPARPPKIKLRGFDPERWGME